MAALRNSGIPPNTSEIIIERLRVLGDPSVLPQMARFGIATQTALGLKIPTLRAFAREIGNNHDLAVSLWQSGIHEARILASMLEDPADVTPAQADAWARDFVSWDLCDQCCLNLFRKLPFSRELVTRWHTAQHPFTKRAAFALMAVLAVHDKKAADTTFIAWLPLIERAADDPDNAVKKGVSWALRQIGKRSRSLHPEAVATATRIAGRDTPSARWISADVLRELRSPAVRKRLARD